MRSWGYGENTARAFFVAGAALTTALSYPTTTLAQCVNNFSPKEAFFGLGGGLPGFPNLFPAANPLVSITNTINTAFLTNTTAFVGAPPSPLPNQGSGGVWTRTIAGYVDTQSKSNGVIEPFVFLSSEGFPERPFHEETAGGTQKCKQSNHQDYEAVQVGADIAKLNIGSSGTNWHFGITGGTFNAKAKDTTPGLFLSPDAAPPLEPGGANPTQLFAPGDLRSQFEVPFIGLYTTVTNGNFFADAQARWDFYHSSSTSQTGGFSGVQNEARGFSVTGSMGYKIPLMSTWFIEPSVGGSWSRVTVDRVKFVDSKNLLSAGGGPLFSFGQILDLNDIDSILGRASLRMGASFTQGIYTWQPFISASVIHEFAGNVTSKVTFGAENTQFPLEQNPDNQIILNVSTERFGTYGQFGLGSAIVVGDTGWLGYGRADLKVGENIQGMGFNVGLRYQW